MRFPRALPQLSGRREPLEGQATFVGAAGNSCISCLTPSPYPEREPPLPVTNDLPQVFRQSRARPPLLRLSGHGTCQKRMDIPMLGHPKTGDLPVVIDEGTE